MFVPAPPFGIISSECLIIHHVTTMVLPRYYYGVTIVAEEINVHTPITTHIMCIVCPSTTVRLKATIFRRKL